MKSCSYSYRTLIIGNQIFEFLFEIDIHLQGLSVWWIIKSLHFRKVFKLKEVAQLLKDVSNISWVNLNSLFFINFISFSLFIIQKWTSELIQWPQGIFHNVGVRMYMRLSVCVWARLSMRLDGYYICGNFHVPEEEIHQILYNSNIKIKS